MSSQRGVIPVAPSVFDELRMSRIAADRTATIRAVVVTRPGSARRTQPARGLFREAWKTRSWRAARSGAAGSGTGEASTEHQPAAMTRWSDQRWPLGTAPICTRGRARPGGPARALDPRLRQAATRARNPGPRRSATRGPRQAPLSLAGHLHGLESGSRELLPADRRDSRILACLGDRKRSVHREDDPEIGSRRGPRRPPGLEIGTDGRVHRLAVGVLEMDIEVMAGVRLVPVDVDRNGDAHDELRWKLGETEDVPRPAEDVELAVDGLRTVGKHQRVDVHDSKPTTGAPDDRDGGRSSIGSR